jgi:hypothetical protein
MDIIRFFPSVLAATPVKISKANKKNIYNFAKTLEFMPLYKNVNDDKFIKDKNKSEVSKLNKVLKEDKLSFINGPLQMGLDHFNNQVMNWDCKPIIVNSWFHKIKPNQESEIINQSNSLLTGILFLDVEDKHPSLIFEKEMFGFNPNVKQFNEFNMTRACVNAKSDYFGIIPSNIKFKFSCNRSNKTHYNLMFSTMPKGNLGYNTTELGLN